MVSDVNPSEEDYAICHFPEHREFVKLCRETEGEAKRTGQKSYFWWRGYRGVVAAHLPPITPPGLEMRLFNALQKISDKSVAETMVKILIYIKIMYIKKTRLYAITTSPLFNSMSGGCLLQK